MSQLQVEKLEEGGERMVGGDGGVGGWGGDNFDGFLLFLARGSGMSANKASLSGFSLLQHSL